MMGKYPYLFKVTSVRNPVTNIVSMVTTTDIPDWCYVESFGNGKYNFKPPQKHQIDRMWYVSPIRYMDRVQGPMLKGLGMMDRRVPPSQVLEYFHAIKQEV